MGSDVTWAKSAQNPSPEELAVPQPEWEEVCLKQEL